MWFFEYTNPGTGPFEQRGTIELNLEHVAERKPAWLIGLRLAGVVGIVAIFLLATVPWLPLPLLQSIPLMLFVFFLYSLMAHYVRPRPNTDNMGWIGGMMNDPFQYNDNINRALFQLHCTLGPGRFAAAATIDALVGVGLLPERTVEHIVAEREVRAEEAYEERAQEVLQRVEEIQAQQPFQHTVQLSSERFLYTADDSPDEQTN